jgi:copper resistance protein C
MKKQVLSLLFLLFMVFHLPLSVFAHSELETAAPAEGETVTTDLEALVLTFSTKIESLSSVTLTNGEKEIPIQLSIEDNQMTGRITNQLENGEYKVEYKVIGADGHAIEGNYHFKVDRPEQAASEQEKKSEQAFPEPDKKDQPKNPGYFAPLTIVLFVAAAIISFFIFRRKR